MKKVFMSITLMLGLIILTACSLFGTKPGENDIVVWADATYWGGTNGELVTEFLEKYTEETEINVIFAPQADLDTRLRSAAQGGESPDVVIWDRWETTRYIREDRFVKINDYVTKDGIDLAEYQQEALSEMMMGDDVYGLPLDIDAWGFWVNKTALNEAGINKLPETWDELRTAAKAMTKYDDQGRMTRAGMNLNISGSFYSFLQTAGGEMLNEDGSRVAFNTESGAAVLQYLYDMIHVDGIYDRDFGAGSQGGGVDDPFLTGRLAIQSNSLLNGTSFYETYADGSFEYEFIPFPKGPSTELEIDGKVGEFAGGLMGGFGLAIPVTSTKQDGAWDLIKYWITDTDNAVAWSEISGLIPSKLSVIEDPAMLDIPNVRNVIEVLPYLKVRPSVEGYTSVETSVIMSKIEGFLFEGAYDRGNPTTRDKAQAALNDMEKLANEILEFTQS